MHLRYTTPPGCRTYQSVNQCDTLAGSRDLAMPFPRVIGATPLDPGLKNGHPCRGASFPSLHDEMNSFCTAQMRHPCQEPHFRTVFHPGLWLGARI